MVVSVTGVAITPAPDSIRIAVIGDSLSAYGTKGALYPNDAVTEEGDMWWAQLRDMLNRPVSGCMLSISADAAFSLPDDAPAAPWRESNLAVLDADGIPDVVILSVGLRDAEFGEAGYAATALSDDEPTTARGVALTLEAIQSRWPEAKIVLLIPPETFPQGGSDSLASFNWRANTIQDVGMRYGVSCILDLRTLYPEGQGRLPNAADMAEIARRVAEALNR